MMAQSPAAGSENAGLENEGVVEVRRGNNQAQSEPMFASSV
jgi:hypothetical protein